MPEVTCTRCGSIKPGFERSPFPGQIGTRVVAEICQTCWGDWLRQQTMLINHYGLNLRDPDAQKFLMQQLEEFFFGEGARMPEDWTPEAQPGPRKK